MDTYAYNPPKPKNKVILFVVVFLILCVIAIIVYLVNLEDEEYPDVPAPAPAPASGLTAEDVRAIVAENNSQLSATDIQILQLIEEGSDDGGGVNVNSGVNRCKDIKQYKDAEECEDINSDSEAEEKCKEGRWVNSASREKKAVLCKWDNNDGCVTDSDCESDYNPDPSPDPPDEPPGDGGNPAQDPEPDGGGNINYCKMILDIKPLFNNVNIEKKTLDNFERKEKSSGGSDGGGWETIRDRKSVRDNLRVKLKEIEVLLTPTYTENTENNICENLIQQIITPITEFNKIFNDEIDYTNEVTQDVNEYEYQNRDINFKDIRWEFADVETPGDLQDVLDELESDTFKNYEPYHNGNSRSSRKVPKPYDEHFVNFRSY